MDQFVPIILWSWVPASLLLFWLLRPQTTVLLTLLVGWAILPVMDYGGLAPEHRSSFWIMGVSLPGQFFLTKATAAAMAALLGTLLFDIGRWKTFRPHWADLPVAIWCICPLLAFAGGNAAGSAALRDAAYLLLAWGVPYLLGRVYFRQLSEMHPLSLGVVAIGLVSVPACLLEFPAGPKLYAALYGYHPFQTEGAHRYIGYRPLLLLEDGNQLGMWLAGSALVAAWLWFAGALPRIGRIPGSVVAGLLVAITLASQSAGAIILLLGGLVVLWLMQRMKARTLAIALAVGIAAFLTIRATGAWSVQTFAKKTPLGQRITQLVKSTGRGSVGWRLKLEEQHLKNALQHPIVGAGRTDWWRGSKEVRPWGLWLLAFGAYGIVGLLTLHLIFLIPAFILLSRIPPYAWRLPQYAAPAALAMLLFISMVDNLLNSTFILPYLLAAGALVNVPRDTVIDGRRSHRSGSPGHAEGS